jgi:DNA modification methylase/sporulation protein YlmC with PRC-barrel domain
MSKNVNSMESESSIDVRIIEINPELKKLIYPLSSEEYQLLEQSIIDDGCRDAIILWNKIIVDGHNRYEICIKHNIFFNTIQKEFENIEYVKEWIILNQFGRRNINDYERGHLANILKEIEQKRFTEKQNEIKTQIAEGGPFIFADRKKLVTHKKGEKAGEVEEITIDSREELAKKAGISYTSISNVKKIEDSGEEIIIDATKTGSLKISQAALLINKDVDKKTLEKAKEAIEIIQNEANDKTVEELRAGKRKLNETLKEIKAKKKNKKLEAKKAEYIEKFKTEIDIMPEVSLMDCNEFLNTFDDDSIDLLFTDPPYMTDVPDITKFTESWLSLAIQKTKKTGRMLVCAGSYPMEIQAFLNVLLKQTKFIVDNPLIWVYKNTLGVTPKMKYNLNYQFVWHLYSDDSPELDTSITNEMFSVMEENAPDGRQGDRLHTWQKPDNLAFNLIKHTTKEGDLVIDPFTCTGTFLFAANKLGRVGKGCDNDQKNLDIATSRGCILVERKAKTEELAEEDNV